MSAASQDTAIRTGRMVRIGIYLVLLIFALFYLLPLYVMLVNSVKPLGEITGGGMMNLPRVFTLAPWAKAWSSAQIGVQPTGLSPYFWELNQNGGSGGDYFHDSGRLERIRAHQVAVQI